MLTALKIKHARPGRHHDHHGLYLVVRPTGGKFWSYRVQRDGKRRELGLGSLYDVSLEDARVKAFELRQLIKRGGGFEALESEEAKPLRPLKPKPKAPTFEKVTRDCYDALQEGWDDRRKGVWIASLEQHIFPIMGKTPIDQIDAAKVRDALAPIWLKIPDTARRILQRIQAVMDFAHISGQRGDVLTLRTVRKGLPRQTDRSNHYAAMPYAKVPALAKKLRNAEPSMGRDALQFLILTAARSGEVRGMTWSEVDRQKQIWSLPADRMKAREPHIVPLSPQAMSILERRWKLRTSDDGLVFTHDGKRPLSDMTLGKALKADATGCTVHGFRSSFTDWASEKTDFPKEVADKALAHKIPDRVEAAYRRTDFFDKRRDLMGQWGNFLDGNIAQELESETIEQVAEAA